MWGPMLFVIAARIPTNKETTMATCTEHDLG